VPTGGKNRLREHRNVDLDGVWIAACGITARRRRGRRAREAETAAAGVGRAQLTI